MAKCQRLTNSPGNDLSVTEEVGPGPGGSEIITIWVEAETSGDPLFVNTLDLEELVFFEVFDLHWDDPTMGTLVSDIEVMVTFPDAVMVTPVFVDVFGLGTPSDPLDILIELDPSDFYSPAGDITGMPATDLHVSFRVDHFVIPEPSSLVLAGLTLVGMLARGRRRVG